MIESDPRFTVLPADDGRPGFVVWDTLNDARHSGPFDHRQNAEDARDRAGLAQPVTPRPPRA